VSPSSSVDDEAAIVTEREQVAAERERVDAASAKQQHNSTAAEVEKERVTATAAAENKCFEAVTNTESVNVQWHSI